MFLLTNEQTQTVSGGFYFDVEFLEGFKDGLSVIGICGLVALATYQYTNGEVAILTFCGCYIAATIAYAFEYG